MSEISSKMYISSMSGTRHSWKTLMKLEFSRQNFENTQIPNFINFHLVGAELLDRDGQTDAMKLIVVILRTALKMFARKEQQITLVCVTCWATSWWQHFDVSSRTTGDKAAAVARQCLATRTHCCKNRCKPPATALWSAWTSSVDSWRGL